MNCEYIVHVVIILYKFKSIIIGTVREKIWAAYVVAPSVLQI